MDRISDELISKAKEGDTTAFEMIYKEYAKFVYNVAWRIVDTHDAAQEVTQEVFICVYRKLRDFRFESTFKTWLYRIAINTAINYSKKMKRDKGKTMEYEEQVHSVAVYSDAESESNKEFNEKIVAALLNMLNEDQRICVVLRNMEGLSCQEIAETLNINPNTVRTRLCRAREAMLQMRKEVVNNEV